MRTIIESPFAANEKHSVAEHVSYAKACCKDSTMRGEIPFASHLFFTQFLDDKDPEQRKLGITMGFDFWEKADRVVFYVDMGISGGMKDAIAKAILEGKPYEVRNLRHAPQGQEMRKVVLDPGHRAYAPPDQRPGVPSTAERIATQAEAAIEEALRQPNPVPPGMTPQS